MYDVYLYHHGVKGMKWGVRKKEKPKPGTFTASNGMKVAPSKNTYTKVMGKIAANRGVEKLTVNTYRSGMKGKHTDTLTNRMEALKGEQRMRKEAQALREYNAYEKDLRKGTGTKYLDRAVRKNKIDDAFEKVQSSASLMETAFFSDDTRRKAAKYIVDNNMSLKDAKKKANKEAVRNTMIRLAINSTIKVADIQRQERKQTVDEGRKAYEQSRKSEREHDKR